MITQEQILLAQKWEGIRYEEFEIFSDLANEELEYYQEKYNIIDYQEQPFCIIAYNLVDNNHVNRISNIKSILVQNYYNYRLIYVSKIGEENENIFDKQV